jgi:FlaA1/EpsC-like NDP-sugar epimerase
MFKQINYRHLLTDLFLVVFSAYASLMLRVNPEEARFFLPHLIKLLPLIVAFRLMFFLYFETYNIIWRYVSAVDAYRLAKSVLVSTIFIVATSYIFSTNS